jgi:hypothetical protein
MGMRIRYRTVILAFTGLIVGGAVTYLLSWQIIWLEDKYLRATDPSSAVDGLSVFFPPVFFGALCGAVTALVWGKVLDRRNKLRKVYDDGQTQRQH